MLEEGECEHRHEGMTVKALPGSSLEVVEAEFLFQLLMGLFTNPSPLDGGGQGAQIGRGRQICEVVFLLARGAVFADKPGFVARQMLLALVPDPLRWSVGCAYADLGSTVKKGGCGRTLLINEGKLGNTSRAKSSCAPNTGNIAASNYPTWWEK